MKLRSMQGGIIFLIFKVLIGASFIQAEFYDPDIVVVIMVKNEEEVLQKTLQPFADAGYMAFSIFDTGSTDKTIEEAYSFIEKNQVIGFVDQEPFINFEVSRNRGMELARCHFPRAGFFLMIDADYYIENAEKLRQFCHEELCKSIESTPTSYMINVDVGNCICAQVRLVRSESYDRWHSKVHEVIVPEREGSTPSDIVFYYRPTQKGYEKTRTRWLWDVGILMQDLQDNPNSPRTLFYLAQSYECLGDLPNALRYYLLRTQVIGWDEENYLAFYKVAGIYDALGDWDMAYNFYIKAYAYRPTRAEPLIRIAEHFWNTGEYPLCYLFAYQACKMEYPIHDRLSVEKPLYDINRYEKLSCAAYYLNKIKVGKKAAKMALKNAPEVEQYRINVECFEQLEQKKADAYASA